jgi:RimJ/RimL family protein N-acetyltransferase
VTIELLTARLRLRQFREDDLDAFAAMCADAEVMRYVGDGSTLDREGAWRNLALFLGHWTLRGYGLFALVPKAGSAMIGFAGLWQPEGWPGLEIGWRLARPFWRQGYAGEGATAVRDWAFGGLGIPRLVSVIDQANVPSIRLAERLGGYLDRRLVGIDRHRLLYAYDRA